VKPLEKRLLAVLVVAAAICATALNASFCFESLSRRSSLTGRYAEALTRREPGRLESLLAAKAALISKMPGKPAAPPGALDQLGLSLRAKADLSELGIMLIYYAPGSARSAAAVDFTVQGRARGIIDFLEKYSGEGGGPSVLSCRLRPLESSGLVECVMRIGYEL
jgi:hypothetical protein